MSLKPGRYRHYKGRDYQVLKIARHSESEEEMVVYRCLYGNFDLWVRPLAMFTEEVEVEGRMVPRFTFLDDSPAISPAQLTVVLCEPQHPGNIGATARAMANFGVNDLRLVNPCYHLQPDARKFAAHGWPLLGSARLYDDLATALADCSVSIAATRRSGRERKELHDSTLLSALVGSNAGTGRVALVFGREDYGLSTSQVALCDHASVVETSSEVGSLNLAQAVVVFLYEITRHRPQEVL